MSNFLRQYSLFIIGGILLLAFLLRLHRVGTYGIYFDEKSTLLISQGIVLEGANQKDVFTKEYFTPKDFWKPKTLADFIEANIRGDIGNSPTYYGILWLWMEVFGLSDLSMRFPSVLFSTLTVLLLYVFVRRHFRSESLALASAGLAAVEPFFIAYSHMARNYSLSFFLTLLATHLFLLLLKRTENQERATGLYVGYGLVFVLSVLSHYLTVTVFLCHGLYALLYLRRPKTWVALAGTAAVGLGLISLWFLFGGGKYTFFTLNYQANLYRTMALTRPYDNPFGVILPATLPNIGVRAVPIFSDLFIFTNGMGNLLMGLRNTLLALGLGLLATLLLHTYRQQANPPGWVKVALPVVLLAGLPLYTVVPIRFVTLSAALPLFYLIGVAIAAVRDRHDKQLLVLMGLLAFVPTLFLLFMAWRSGHTFGITQRYSGFSFPYVIILVAMGLHQLAGLRAWFRWPLVAALLVQAYFVAKLLLLIYADAEPKYTYFGKPRIANPYWESAKKIEAMYAPGDTILYPNVKRLELTDMDRSFSRLALFDAQLVNVYLPKDAEYPQRIDPYEPDKIVLVKGRTGQRIVIYDLKGKTYRY